MTTFAVLVAVAALATVAFLKIKESRSYGNRRYCPQCMLFRESATCGTCRYQDEPVRTKAFKGFDKMDPSKDPRKKMESHLG